MKLSDRLLSMPGREMPHPNSRVVAALKGAGPAVTPEFERIRALPRRVLDFTQIPDATPVFARAGAPPCTFPGCQIVALRPEQNAMLLDAAAMSGGFFPVGVGFGKTLASLLLPESLESSRAVLLIPPQMKAQLLRADVGHYGHHFRLPHVVDAAARGSVGPAAGPALYVVAYTELSTAGHADVLDRIDPDLIIADEAHNLRHRDAARTRRFLRYMRAHPGCRFVGMSGTLTAKSLRDYAHLIELALRKSSPVPEGGRSFRELEAWADAIDVGAEGPPGALAYFQAEGETVREGFRRRLVESYGVVATEESAVGASLVIRKSYPRVPAPVVDALTTLENTWAWDGEEFSDPLQMARVSRQLSAGFFYRWAWPGGVVDEEWMEARRAWNRAVRDYLTHHNRPGMDSPALLEAAAIRGDWIVPEWPAWAAVKARPAPPVVPVWISDYLVKAAAAWSSQVDQGIVWFLDPPLGHAWAQMTGRPYFGADSDAEILAAHPSSQGIIGCSIKAHGTGKNLQAWSRNYVTFPPASGAGWEQLLGRTHRPGQLADVVEVEVALPTASAQNAWINARAAARYIQETMGQRQKLLYATEVD